MPEKLENRIRAVENAVIEIKGSTQTIAEAVSEMKDFVKEVSPRITKLESRMEAIESNHTKHQDKLWKLITVLLAALLGVSVISGSLGEVGSKVLKDQIPFVTTE